MRRLRDRERGEMLHVTQPEGVGAKLKLSDVSKAVDQLAQVSVVLALTAGEWSQPAGPCLSAGLGRTQTW